MTADDALVVLAVVGSLAVSFILINEVLRWITGWQIRRRLRRLCGPSRMGIR